MQVCEAIEVFHFDPEVRSIRTFRIRRGGRGGIKGFVPIARVGAYVK